MPSSSPPLLTQSSPDRERRRRRRGVTLVELLVVILLLGITAALVLPALTPPRAVEADATAALLTRARRLAIRRGESLRLRVDGDGVWALITARDGSSLETGRIPAQRDANVDASANMTADASGAVATNATLDLTIDALGSCLPSARTKTAARFDPLACAWLPETVDRVAVGAGR